MSRKTTEQRCRSAIGLPGQSGTLEQRRYLTIVSCARSLTRTAIEWGGAGQRKCDNVARMRLQRPSTYNSVTDSHPRDSASYRHAVIEQSCFYQIVQLVFRVLLAIARISRVIHATPLETITDVLYIAGLGWNAKRRWPQLG